MNTIPDTVIDELHKGNVRIAYHFLGTPYMLKGHVIKGNMLGRQLGFPTANLELSGETPLYLANGVYAVYVLLNGRRYKGVTNIGIRPTLNLNQLTIEVNIFDFNEDIYGELLSILFIDRIRDEMKFAGLSALKEQIVKDKAAALVLLEMWRDSDTGT